MSPPACTSNYTLSNVSMIPRSGTHHEAVATSLEYYYASFCRFFGMSPDLPKRSAAAFPTATVLGFPFPPLGGEDGGHAGSPCELAASASIYGRGFAPSPASLTLFPSTMSVGLTSEGSFACSSPSSENQALQSPEIFAPEQPMPCPGQQPHNTAHCPISGGDGHHAHHPNGCQLCDIWCWDANHLQQHFVGKNHQRKLRQLLSKSVIVHGTPYTLDSEFLRTFFGGLAIDDRYILPNSFGCDRDDGLFTEEPTSGPFQYVAFMSIEDAVAALGWSGQFISGFRVHITPARQPWECAFCELRLNSAHQYDQHINSAKHLNRVKVFVQASTLDLAGLPANVSEAQVREFLTGYAIVEPGGVALLTTTLEPTQQSVTLSPIHSNPKMSLVVACRVTFVYPHEARRALLELNGRFWLGRTISLCHAPKAM